MQKLIAQQFFCFPKEQPLSIIYKDINCLKSRLFLALSLQVSPKNGFLLQLRKSKLGHYLSSFLLSSKTTITSLKSENIKIGYINNHKLLLFTFDNNNNPDSVFKKNADGLWLSTPFVGYSVIEEYTKKEYFKKKKFIKLALEKRWQELEKGNNLHGDFTHFNILLSYNNKLTVIDENKCENSKLFDHFYFYSYFIQCLEKCKTISKTHVLEIKKDLQNLTAKICKAKDIKELLVSIDTKKALGIDNKQKKLAEFTNFMLKNER